MTRQVRGRLGGTVAGPAAAGNVAMRDDVLTREFRQRLADLYGDMATRGSPGRYAGTVLFPPLDDPPAVLVVARGDGGHDGYGKGLGEDNGGGSGGGNDDGTGGDNGREIDWKGLGSFLDRERNAIVLPGTLRRHFDELLWREAYMFPFDLDSMGGAARKEIINYCNWIAAREYRERRKRPGAMSGVFKQWLASHDTPDLGESILAPPYLYREFDAIATVPPRLVHLQLRHSLAIDEVRSGIGRQDHGKHRGRRQGKRVAGYKHVMQRLYFIAIEHSRAPSPAEMNVIAALARFLVERGEIPSRQQLEGLVVPRFTPVGQPLPPLRGVMEGLASRLHVSITTNVSLFGQEFIEVAFYSPLEPALLEPWLDLAGITVRVQGATTDAPADVTRLEGNPPGRGSYYIPGTGEITGTRGAGRAGGAGGKVPGMYPAAPGRSRRGDAGTWTVSNHCHVATFLVHGSMADGLRRYLRTLEGRGIIEIIAIASHRALDEVINLNNYLPGRWRAGARFQDEDLVIHAPMTTGPHPGGTPPPRLSSWLPSDRAGFLVFCAWNASTFAATETRSLATFQRVADGAGLPREKVTAWFRKYVRGNPVAGNEGGDDVALREFRDEFPLFHASPRIIKDLVPQYMAGGLATAKYILSRNLSRTGVERVIAAVPAALVPGVAGHPGRAGDGGGIIDGHRPGRVVVAMAPPADLARVHALIQEIDPGAVHFTLDNFAFGGIQNPVLAFYDLDVMRPTLGNEVFDDSLCEIAANASLADPEGIERLGRKVRATMAARHAAWSAATRGRLGRG